MVLKRILSFIVTAVCVLQLSVCCAAEKIDQEINLLVGIIFGVDAENLKLTILRGIAQIVEVNGEEQLYCTQTGDVLLNARFTSSQYPGKYLDYKYLIHVVKEDDLEAADRMLAQKEANRIAAIDTSKFPQQVLDLVNKERAKAGLHPLCLAGDLQQAAAVRAREITRVLSHNRPDGSKFYTVLRSKWGAGENIATGYPTPEEAVEGWMNSPGHRANILRKGYKELGVGYCYDDNGVGGYKHYWVQIFRE